MGCSPNPTGVFLDAYLSPGPCDLFRLLPNDNRAILWCLVDVITIPGENTHMRSEK
jgi:hypothetical protein